MSEYWSALSEALQARYDKLAPSAKAKFVDGLWKMAEGDWHGGSDANNDLRVVEAQPVDGRCGAYCPIDSKYRCGYPRGHALPHQYEEWK